MNVNDTPESERDRRYKKWIETGDQRWLDRSTVVIAELVKDSCPDEVITDGLEPLKGLTFSKYLKHL